MKLIIAVFLFILSIFLIGQNLDKPFWGEHDWNGARYGNIARNYLRYGLIDTKLGQVENSGFIKEDQFEYFTHYPPFLPILIAISYKLFGVSEWSTRLVPLLATSGTIVLIFLIGTHVADLKRGTLASLLAVVTPMSLYFGKNPVHEPVVVFFILLSFWGYLRGQKLIFLVGMVLAELTTWAGYFLIPAITLVLFFRKEREKIRQLIPYWIITIFIFVAHLTHVTILTGSVSGGNLFESLVQRVGIAKDVQPEGFNLLGYILKVRLWFSTLFTITLSILAVIWLITIRRKFKDNDWRVFVLGILGLIYLVLFSNAVFIHNYLIFYSLPFLSLAGSGTIVYLMKIRILYSIKYFLPIVFLVAIFLERKNFVDALNISNTDKLAVEIGKFIKSQTSESDTVLVSPIKYSYSAEKFLKFYSDRRLIFADDSQLDYDYIVAVNQDLSTFQISRK